ncbi:hypothetical protein [Acinetobacter ursingii]
MRRTDNAVECALIGGEADKKLVEKQGVGLVLRDLIDILVE